MRNRFRALIVPALALAFVAPGCNDDELLGGGPPPDLTGTYTLQSFSSAATGGFPLTPPTVTGTFTLVQTSSSATEASGTLEVSITVPDGMGGTNTINDQGTFTIRSNGTWEQSGQQQQGSGTYTLAGNVLTVEVTSPQPAVSTSVWQRQ